MGVDCVENQPAEQAVRSFLEFEGLDLCALGMEKTPSRVALMYSQLFDGLGEVRQEEWGELFPSEAGGLVAVRHIPFYSMCEHHLVPFFGEVSIVYQPREGLVAGFSKFTKVVEHLSHRPQLQERLTRQIAAAVAEGVGAEGVLVMVEAQQLCMMMRGDLAPGTKTVTTECTGCFAGDKSLYQQAWQLLGGEGK